ncbi:MAG: hypothetical protein VW268_02405 [Rhodospirillaceae bacterium]
MRDFFLGKPWHWLIVVGIFCGMWVVGSYKLHVTNFNPFIMLIMVGAAFIVLLLVKTTKRNEQITRDPLPESADAAEDTSGPE